MWTWEEKDVPLIPEKYEIFKKLTPNNRRMFGCYRVISVMELYLGAF